MISKTIKRVIKMRKLILFEGNTLQEAMNKLLDSGLEWASDKEVMNWNKKNRSWINLFQSFQPKGIFKRLTKAQAKNLKAFYAKRGRLLFLGDYHNPDLIGYDYLHYSGRFIGIKK